MLWVDMTSRKESDGPRIKMTAQCLTQHCPPELLFSPASPSPHLCDYTLTSVSLCLFRYNLSANEAPADSVGCLINRDNTQESS